MHVLAIKICSPGGSVASHLAAVPLLGTHKLYPLNSILLNIPRQTHEPQIWAKP